jgi:hypothetical protein
MPGAIHYLHSIDFPTQDLIASLTVAVSTFVRFFGDPGVDPGVTWPSEVGTRLRTSRRSRPMRSRVVHDDRVAGPGVAEQLVQAVTVDSRAGLLGGPGNSYLMDRGPEARKRRTDVPGARQLVSPRRASSIRFTLSERSGLLMIQQITPSPRTARRTTAATVGVPIRES